MITVDKNSKVPIYAQIESSVYDLILDGELVPGQMVPSVRIVAKENKINPNTVQKAFSELIKNGILYSVSGKGNFVSDKELVINHMERQEILKELAHMASKAKAAGIWMDEIFSTVDAAYSK